MVCLYLLEKPTKSDFYAIYNWKKNETNHEYFTCRPVKDVGSADEYFNRIEAWMAVPGNMIRVLKDSGSNEILGEIKAFDYNPRNQSLEIGFYLPEKARGKKTGAALVKAFIAEIFLSTEKPINKIYATTSEINIASQKVLVKNGFILDGKNREHYWIQENRYDQFVYSILKKEWLKINQRTV